MSEQTNKFFIDASFNHLIEVKNNGDALLTIHNDGTITAAEHLKPTETAAEVLRIMRETWMADAQSIKIRDQQERIKRLEDSIEKLKDAGDLVFIWLIYNRSHLGGLDVDSALREWKQSKKEAKP
jgi:PDZ domain-containing secreted protein